MDMRILKKSAITYCATCEDVNRMRVEWDNEQKLLVDSGAQEECTQFPGVSGYIIRDNDDYTYCNTGICEKCMNTIIKGVTIINEKGLTGISLDTNK